MHPQGLSLLPMFSLPFYGTSMVFMLIYLWSRYYPTANVKIWGLVDVKVLLFGASTPCCDAHTTT